MATVRVKGFYDESGTSTITYVAIDDSTKTCVVIDPVLEFDYSSGRTSQKGVDQVQAFITAEGLKVQWLLETHVHADHITGSAALKKYHPEAKTAIGTNVKSVQEVFSGIFNLKGFPCDGSQFDVLLEDGATLSVGSIEGRVMYTPGHTPACCCYVLGDAVFTGDTIFMPDMGTARCDFPGGSATTLYASVQKLYALPDATRVFVGHDYQPGGRDVAFETTISASKAENKSLKATTTEQEFVEWRSARDASLDMPKLILPSLQVNLRAGVLPDPEANGTAYLKIPVNTV